MKYLIILSLLFLGCEKEKTEPVTWYLSLDIPAFSYSEILPVKAIYDNIGASGQKIGNGLDFSDSRLKCRVYTESAGIKQLTGTLDNHSFILINDSLNVCSGLQRVFVDLKLEIR